MSSDADVFAAYTTKTVDFRYRGASFHLGLSHGLFSSADVDSGSRFLLRFLSLIFDAAVKAGKPLPKTVLDAGSGIGVLGLAIGRTLVDAGNPGVAVRAQDRDELARVFSAQNAVRNGLGAGVFNAFTEKMLDGSEGARYDLIVSNLPAKAGSPVLANFFHRSSRMLTAGGSVAVVIVNTLADSARKWLRDADAPILAEETGIEHTVFVYGESRAPGKEAASDPYLRTEAEHELESIRYAIRALHGVADFTEPSRAVAVAAKLALKLGVFARVLVHEAEQGHFPVFLASAARREKRSMPDFVICGRNTLALEAARDNTAACGAQAVTVPVADFGLCAEQVSADFGNFDLVATFPDIVPRTDRFTDTWKGAAKVLLPGGYLVIAVSSSDAARFDKLKTTDFTRAGDLKRDGFRALAYRRK
ncbi:MAG: methyltransferase [Treponemataceae bacterium]